MEMQPYFELIQVEDMKIVLKRYVTHFKENDRLATPPIKLTRTVGLQVNDSTTYLEHPKLVIY